MVGYIYSAASAYSTIYLIFYFCDIERMVLLLDSPVCVLFFDVFNSSLVLFSAKNWFNLVKVLTLEVLLW